jgi:lipopolysaccharide transport system permease protein
MTRPQRWDNVSSPAVPWLDFNLRELLLYRDLFKQYVYRNFVTNYKQSILGPLWFIIKPALTTIVFTVVFGKVARISTGHVPAAIFYMASTIIWSFFSTCLSSAANTFNANSSVFGKIYFPRLIIPLAEMVSPLIPFAAHFFVFLALYGFYVSKGQIDLSGLIFLPLLLPVLLQAALTALGVGLIFASITTKYKDLLFLVDFITQLWMYVTPVVYPVAQIPGGLKWLALCNPLTGALELSRKIFFNAFDISPSGYILNFALAILLALAGLIFFNKIEKTFIDTL